MSKLIGTIISIVLAVILAAISGCSDTDTYNPIYAQYIGPPVVTGMIFTDERGNYVGGWGEPTSTVAVYPNPTNGPFAIQFALEKGCRVSVWVVKAYGPGESVAPIFSSAGAETYVPYGAPIRILMDQEYRAAGISKVVWDITDDLGNAVPAGFYRIYVARDNSLAWADVLFVRDCADVPYYINLPDCD